MKNFAIKAKKAIKKVAAVSVGAALVGSTLFGAAAATTLNDYPAPFVQDGLWNTVIVVGADSFAGDIVGAIDVSARLSQTATTAHTETGTITDIPDGVNLNIGTSKLWLGEKLNSNVNIITKTNFPALLADEVFSDDLGNEVKYSQKIEPGEATFAFGNANGELDDPELIIQAGEQANIAAERFFTYTLTFESPLNFTSRNVQGEKLVILGEEYTIGSGSTENVIQLFGGAMSVNLNWGETKTITFGGKNYEIRLGGIQQHADGNIATIIVDGDSRTVRQDASRKIGGLDVYADTVNYYGLDAYPGDVVITLGADELYLEDGMEIMVGSGKDYVYGTHVEISDGGDFTEVSGITVHFAADDRENNHLTQTDQYTDLIFGKVKVIFAEAVVGETSLIETIPGVKEELKIRMTDSKGNKATVPFAYIDTGTLTLADRNGGLSVVEGAPIQEKDYFILNAGGNQHFMQLRRFTARAENYDDVVSLRDMFTGVDTTITTDLNTTNGTFILEGREFTVEKINANSIMVYRYADGISVYPYVELFSTGDAKVAWTNEVVAIAGASDGDTYKLNLPTGTIDLDFADVATNSCNVTLTGATPTSILGNDTERAVQVGNAHYVFTVTDLGGNTDACQDAIVTIALSANQVTGNDVPITDPALMIVEDKNNIDSQYNALVLTASKSGTGDEYVSLDAGTAKWTYTIAPTLEPFDNSDYGAAYSTFGTYLYSDTSGTNRNLAEITIPREQMYANVFIAPTGATTTTTTTTGAVAIQSVTGVETAKLDTEITDKTSKPMILIGGPAVNRLTAEVAGLSYPTYGPESADVFGYGPGKATIQLFENAFGGNKVAMVVAGWEEGDTRKACKVLKDFENYDLSGKHMIVTGTATTPVIEPYVEAA